MESIMFYGLLECFLTFYVLFFHMVIRIRIMHYVLDVLY